MRQNSTPIADDQLVQSLCGWLSQARAIGERLGSENGATRTVDGEAPIGLMRLVEEFTALRQEVKLQQRGARGLEENTSKQADALRQAIEALRAIEPREQEAAWSAGKGLALALADIDEALARGRRQLERSIEALNAETDEALEVEEMEDDALEDDALEDEVTADDVEAVVSIPEVADREGAIREVRERIEAAYQALPAWKRWFAKDLYLTAIEALPEPAISPPAIDDFDAGGETEQALQQDDPQQDDPPQGASFETSLAGLAALRDGFAMMHARLARAMAAEGLQRIVTEGEIVDPELMLVLETIEADAPAGMVLEEIRPGYLWNNKLLRSAEVRAASPREW